MTNEGKLVVELWDYFRDQLPKGGRADAAAHLLRLFQEYGMEVSASDIEGECDYLDAAALIVLDEDEDDDFSYDGYGDEDD